MFITKKIMVDSNSGPVWEAHNRLKKAGIRSTLKTMKGKTAFGNHRDCQISARYGFSPSTVDPNQYNFTYMLTVWAWDEKRAREVLELA